MVSVFALNQQERLDEETYNRMLRAVSSERQKRVGKFLRWEDAQRALTAEVLLRIILVNNFGLDSDAIHFSTNKYGKPFLTHDNGPMFSISHSGKWVVCAFGSNPVGGDVEAIRPTDFKIAERYFTENEYALIKGAPENLKEKQFYDLWTLKESYIKTIGKGLYKALDSFEISLKEKGWSVSDPEADNEYNFCSFEIDDEYRFSVCYQGSVDETELKVFTIEEFITVFNDAVGVSSI